MIMDIQNCPNPRLTLSCFMPMFHAFHAFVSHSHTLFHSSITPRYSPVLHLAVRLMMAITL